MAKKFLLEVARLIPSGSLTLTFPEGDVHEINGKKDGIHADLQIVRRQGLMRILKDGKMGFCEAYMEGEVESQTLVDLIEYAVTNNQLVEQKLKMNPISWLFTRIGHIMRRNSKVGSRKNISYHYDLGNDFYALWLDETMTYSSAVFDNDTASLADAQNLKYRKLAEMAELQPGDHVLEIGCGWGGFAEFAAREYDVTLTCITISQEQYDFAKARIEAAGLSDRVTIKITDYRDLASQSFDKVISIEMFEAVGMAYWSTYFNKISDVLRKGGKAALQVITIEDHEFDSYRATPDFIQKYIFPGGMLPSMERIEPPINASGMKLTETKGYGLHYAKTLEKWRHDFVTHWPTISSGGKFDAKFKRMWELYLAYCEGGFKSGMIDVKQMTLTKE
ncbi:MAG: class I SAM-dependent methyltransferase [Candidatus Puniceispirillaceae bacterium]